MGILIKGLDVTALNDDSSVCYKDIRLFADGSATTSSGEPPYIKTFEWVEVPTPHGDLIDRDKLKPYTHIVKDRMGKPIGLSERFSIKDIKDAPTVIEGEE